MNIRTVSSEDFKQKCGNLINMVFGPSLWFYKVYENGYAHILRDDFYGNEIESESEYVLVDDFDPTSFNLSP